MIGLPERTPDALLADKGYDADAIRADLAERKIKAVIPSGPAVIAPQVTIPTLPEPKSLTLKGRVAATLIVRSWAVPGINNPQTVPLNVLASVLGGLPARA